MTNLVQFPGLGLSFELDRVAFSIGGMNIYWYGVCIAVGMCLALVFAFVVLRGMSHALKENDGYVRLAATGLIMQFGLQSCINMAVNLHLMPAKGMTLPFISYGGSSLVAVALSMGMLLALTRKRPDQTRFVAPIEFSPLPSRG